MKKIYVEMVADLFHYGHAEFLRKARALGDHLTVGILSDEWAKKYKTEPVMSREERARAVESCRYVDEVLRQAEPASDQWLAENGFITAIAMKNDADRERHLATSVGYDRAREVELPYEHGISSTDIIQRIEDRAEIRRKNTRNIRKFFAPRWGAGEWALAEQMLQDIGRILNTKSVPYFLAFGSHLGAVRHGGVIPWDDDIDIAIREQDEKTLESLAPLMNEAGYELIQYTGISGPHTEIYYKMWIRNKRSTTDKTHSWPFIDIFVLRPSAADPAQCGLDHRMFAPSEIFPLKTKSFGALTLPVPNNDDLLATLYDADYMTRCFSTSYVHRDERLEKKILSCAASDVAAAGCFADLSAMAETLRRSVPMRVPGWLLDVKTGKLAREWLQLQAGPVMAAVWDRIDGQRTVADMFAIFGGPRIETMRAALDSLNLLQQHGAVSLTSSPRNAQKNPGSKSLRASSDI